MTTLYSIILAGGSGKRLWPLSREMSPKQMFKLNDELSLYQKTFLKMAALVDDKNIITTTNEKYSSDIKEQLKVFKNKFERKQDYIVLDEPVLNNTAPSISIGVKYISDNCSEYSSPVIITVPSDQVVFNREKFAETLQKGIKLAQNGYIVSFVSETIDINEQFGYVKLRKNTKVSDIEPLGMKVVNFVEKPSSKKQKEELKGKLYVNSGIYMFTAETFFCELKKYQPEIYNLIKDLNVEPKSPSVPMEIYEQMPDVSIDYAIMEKSKKIAGIVLDTEWKDIGSWDAVYEMFEKDSNGNVFKGRVVDIDSENSMAYSTSKLVATMGLKDTFVIETEDAILVCDKNNTDSVKNIYKKLNDKNSKTREVHKTVYRPWGYYTVLQNGSGFLTKCITVNPNSKLSLQLHHHRSEHWVILEGQATVIKSDETYKLNPGESIDIDIEEVHSLQNLGDKLLKVIEIQQGDILDETDIERLEDIYGRV